MARIIIDSRESDLCHALDTINTLYERAALPVGDVRLDGNDGKCLLLERKTLEDYRSSLLDGRLACQKSRALALTQSDPNVKFFYVFESKRAAAWTENKTHGISESTIATSLAHLTVRDNVGVLHTASTNDTALLIKKLHASMQSGKLEPRMTAIATLGKRPRDLIADNPIASLLVTVPGVSCKLATRLSESFPTASSLITSNVNDIANITGPNGRKVGPAVSKKIKTFFC